jgi:Ca-activated chloride channel family protein
MFKSGRAGLLVVLACLVAVGCSGAAYPTSRPAQQEPPQHHWPPRVPPEPTPARPAWPTEASYQGVEFEDAGVNPFVDPLGDPFSTFAMDVDTASYGIARRFIGDGYLPDRDSVRLEEFVNSFDYGYEPPTDGAFAIHVDGAPAPFVGSRAVLVRVGIQAREVPDEARKSISLTFVIDTSGSMQMENRLELVKNALILLVSRLRADDSVAIVEFGSQAGIVLTPTSAAEPEAIIAAISALDTGGSTNAQAGLELGYNVAARGHRPGAVDRVVLASDGVANVGLTDADSILQRIDHEVEAGVELVSIGVGMGNFNDVLLEQLANRGNGFYTYINDRFEAERVFGSDLTGTLQTVARDARIQVEFRSDAVVRYRLLGYENRRMADEDFRNPYADAGEVGAGHNVTALYEIEPAWTRGELLGTVRLRWQDPATGAEEQLLRDIELLDLDDSFYSAEPGFRLAATVAGFAEILRQSPYATEFTLDDVAHEATELAGRFDGRLDVIEFAQLAQMAARISDY